MSSSPPALGSGGFPRASRFREHTSTVSSIHPPPDELWKDIDVGGLDKLLDGFAGESGGPAGVAPGTAATTANAYAHKKSTATATVRTVSVDDGTAAAALPTHNNTNNEGPLGRFFAFFGSVLGKRKGREEEEESREREIMEQRKRTAEMAYAEAKELGLLPAPKVFVRPGMAAAVARAGGGGGGGDVDPNTPFRASYTYTPTPRTAPPTTATTTKKDLSKQKKLSKRVSSLEVKLASAKKDLQSALGHDCFPTPPPLHPLHTSFNNTTSTPNSPLILSDSDTSTPTDAFPSAPLPSHIAKKRRSTTLASPVKQHQQQHQVSRSIDIDRPVPTSTHADATAPQRDRTIRRVRSASARSLRRTSSRLGRKLSRGSLGGSSTRDSEGEEEEVVMVRPGRGVPPVPRIPGGVLANKEGGGNKGDDGYGGLGHEMF